MASFHPFPRLPHELRQAIIEEFLQELGKTKSYLADLGPRFFESKMAEFTKRAPRLAKYAAIDRQWKSTVEKRTFRTLSLRVGGFTDPDILDTFGNLARICVEDRIDAVSKIHLSIILDNPRNRQTRSSNDVMKVGTGQGSRSDANIETDASIVHCERLATVAFGRFFRVLKNWSSKRNPLSLTSELLWKGSRRGRLPTGTQLRIHSSGFPEASCIGSFETPENTDWGIQPASAFGILAKLPNAKRATVMFGDDLDSPGVIDSVQGELSSISHLHEDSILTQLVEGHSMPCFQGTKLKSLSLSLESPALWHRRPSHRLRTLPSLQLTQLIFSMTSKLEEVYLHHMVDVPAFLRQACAVSGTTPQGNAAWPNLRILCVKGFPSSPSLSNDSPVAAELYDAITAALPHMPNITRFDIAISSPFYVGERCYWNDAIIYMKVPPRDDRSAMDDGMLFLCGTEPDQETMDAWKQIARRQWHCKLVKGNFVENLSQRREERRLGLMQ